MSGLVSAMYLAELLQVHYLRSLQQTHGAKGADKSVGNQAVLLS